MNCKNGPEKSTVYLYVMISLTKFGTGLFLVCVLAMVYYQNIVAGESMLLPRLKYVCTDKRPTILLVTMIAAMYHS